jgi:hypothetical protein
MNGKIDKSGHLEINRASDWRMQYCPFDDCTPCGDWCPHFGEPDILYSEKYELLISCGGGRIIEFDSFVDERR